MSLKKEIETGEHFLAEYTAELETIERLLQKGSNAEMLVFLMDKRRVIAEDQITECTERLVGLKKERAFEFETESEECNSYIDDEIETAQKFIDTVNLPENKYLLPLVKQYNDDLPQDQKNEIYTKIKTINAFLNKVKR